MRSIFTLILLGGTCLAATSLADDFTGEKPAVQTADRLEWAWDGGDHFSVGGAAIVHYQPGGDARIVIKGPADLLSQVRYDHGRVRMDDGFFGRPFRDEKLDITLTGMTLRDVSLAGCSVMDMGDIQQDRLVLSIAGSGSVDAGGRAEDLNLHIAGSGDAHLDKLSSARLEAHIAGSGEANLDTTDRAEISIAGSGKLHFTGAAPRDISSHVAGSGVITDSGGLVISAQRFVSRASSDERRQ